MLGFRGFSPHKDRSTQIPAAFFTELLPAIDHLGEMKVTLYALWRLSHTEGKFPYIRRSDFQADEVFTSSLGPNQKAAHKYLDESLRLTVERGTLLQAKTELEGQTESFYFLNDAKGQAGQKAIADGRWQPSADEKFPVKLGLEHPNIYRLYEEHIGPLTPIIAEALKEAEATFPDNWIAEAFQISVKNNVRKWRYIEVILQRWQEEGRDDRTDQRDPEEDRKKYAEGEYSDFIES